MSTDLKTRSKAYTLTRFAMRGPNLGLSIGMGWNKPAVCLSVTEIEQMFTDGDFSRITFILDLLDETMERLKLDLAQFVLSKGNGMEAE